MRKPGAVALGMVVVFVSSAGGSRPKAGLSDRLICYLVLAASRGDIVPNENLAELFWRPMAMLPS
jgi:hypothetical protein